MNTGSTPEIRTTNAARLAGSGDPAQLSQQQHAFFINNIAFNAIFGLFCGLLLLLAGAGGYDSGVR
ncbi:MAG: hypothetical protein J0M04_09790 [Verrucomicrobia bacterium]|nr:hypothetical protein [Verrucomicrobiota bacterium]